ncbi:cytochrome b-c1 complex subunit 6, mitochondrial-like [Physella acuta]|uniref:cytochrome b-c1 complex subunit 6, mitochondrial-like n=1 Tax=Physella acuta TaxID=109671 RepID=UPI0027DC84B3|nr:cytochrome b-c1 complex subunit 6, mitochondrial-like [Physella acuta]
MGLGDKVFAASDPKEELKVETLEENEIIAKADEVSFCDEKSGEVGEVDKNLNEGSQKPPDQDCMCFCFCEDPEDSENPEDDKKEGAGDPDCACFCFCEDPKEPEELVDPLEELRKSCAEKEECSKLKDKLDSCSARVDSKSQTSETCVEELIDFMHCLDHCASKTLFSKLK